MRLHTTLALFFTLGSATEVQSINAAKCKCTPADECWPQACHWTELRKALGGGKLIKTSPLAESCYDGPNKDLAACAEVVKMWPDQDWEADSPIGRAYPYNVTCPPVNFAGGETAGTCLQGISPVYAVNATTRSHIATTLKFAKDNNVRLVVTTTGHDLNGRSDGFGGLELWLRYYRNGINFQQKFKSAKGCTKSGYTGSAIHIDGSYRWRDVGAVARANNVIAISGGATGVGAIGGWPSGGGHGPGTRNYGLGADQILEAEVMLASGQIVTANACENTDLFRAIRGGGPGYGVVLSEHIKVHPNVDVVTAHTLAIGPLVDTPANKDLLDAVTVLLQQMPCLSEKGYAGYGYWFRNFPRAYVGNAKSGYTHGFWAIGKGQAEAEAAMAPTLQLLEQFKDKLSITSSFKTYSDYWEFYYGESGDYDAAGSTSLISSRLIETSAVADFQTVRDTVEIVAGSPQQVIPNVILLVSGGQVFKDAADKTSGLNPAWRKSPFVMITGSGMPKNPSNDVRAAVQHDITYVRGAALKKLSPNTGGYMNEGDRSDPDFANTFYGAAYAGHLATKNKYDPSRLFYCATCVGSESFLERPDGPLCRV